MFRCGNILKKRTKIILIAAASILILGIIFATTDYFRAKSNKVPLFAIPILKYKDGGSVEYFGIGYKIIKCNTLIGDKSIYMGFYNLNINKCRNDIIENGEGKTTGTADYLFNLKTSYIGDNSAVGKLLDTLNIRMYGHYTFELKTSEKPNALIINYSLIEGWGSILNNPETVIEKSAILLALIDNADEIHWVLPDNEIKKITVGDLIAKYGNIKEYGKSVEDFKSLLVKLGYYETKEGNPITMRVSNLSNRGLTLLITNHTKNNYLYGTSYSLQRKENDKWVEVEQIVDICAFTSIGYTLKAEHEVEEKNNWEYCYGKLPSGEYRITKDFDHILSDSDGFDFGKNHIISAEFTI